MNGYSLRSSLDHVGLALRQPEQFALAWHRGHQHYPWWIWATLALTAIAGTTTYGMTMGLLGGAERVLLAGLSCTVAAGLAWSTALPTLYVLNSMTGSRLSLSSTVLAALVTTSWGGLAMIASIPINWFFSVAVPHPMFVLAINLIVFAGVGVAMLDVFRRVMCRLEPQRPAAPLWWLVLVGVIGAELFYFFGLFQFHVIG